jgi:hypothetical protein
MNRSILIVICDFLLVSLLAFSTVDINKATNEGVPRQVKTTIATNQVDNRQDLAAVMRLALEQEHKGRELLVGELAKSREAVGQQQALLGEREKQMQAFRQELQQKEQQTTQLEQQQKGLQQELQQKEQRTVQLEQQQKNLQQELQQKEQRTAQLEQQRENLQQELQQKAQRTAQLEQQEKNLRQDLQQKEQQTAQLEQQQKNLRQELQQKDQQTAQLEQQRTSLQQQFAAAQTNVLAMNQQLQNTSTEAVLSKEKLAAMQAELRKQAEQAAALQQQLGLLAQSNQMVLNEKQRLAGQLQVSEAEKRLITEQVSHMQQEVKVEREEKAKLADGVKALASRSDQLAQEIQQNRAQAPNTIFSQFVSNRVQATFWGVRPGFLGTESNKRTETQTVLVTDGTNTVALCHVQDTPLSFGFPGTDWQGLTGVLGRNTVSVPIKSLSFYQLDPRLVFLPLTAAEARELGSMAYRTSSDPYKFQDAVLVGAQEGYYGECSFQIDLTTPLYVKMDRNSLKGLFGKFNPSRGDLVFSRTGELLGVMANNTYCMMIKNFKPTATFEFARDVRSQQTGETLARLYSLIAALPPKLQ